MQLQVTRLKSDVSCEEIDSIRQNLSLDLISIQIYMEFRRLIDANIDEILLANLLNKFDVSFSSEYYILTDNAYYS